LISYLEQHRGGAAWLVAVGAANSGAAIELASGQPVLAMGGFSGSDPAMTVSHLISLVRSGRLRYVMAGGGPMAGPARGDQSVMSWVTQNCRQVDYGGSGLYDCSGAA
jgi:4-amino-4-deoxy-L-arabinose transferase-like glycosyltransferase